MTTQQPNDKHQHPAEIAAIHMRLHMDGPQCPHGVDVWGERGQTLVYTSYWVCRCCTLIYPGPSPEGMLCGPCGT